MKKLVLLIILLITAVILPDSDAYAMNGMNGGMGHYGDWCPMWGEYGARKSVKTVSETKRILQEYFKNEPVVIGKIKERKLFFEAEIKNKNNNLIDVVIVDRRTGRIRSIY